MIPAAIKQNVRARLEQAVLDGYLSDWLVGETKEAIFTKKGRAWDWDRHWAAHTYFCYAFNFAKAYAITTQWLEAFRGTGPLRILDLGCGAGASSAGSAAAGLEKGHEVTLLGVDSSDPMITFFNQTLPPWAKERGGITVQAEVSNASRYLEQDLSGWDLVLCSYLFCGDSSLRKYHRPSPNRLVVDLMPTGESQVESRGELFGFTFDSERPLDVSFLDGLLPQARPQEVRPAVIPLAALQSVNRLRQRKNYLKF